MENLVIHIIKGVYGNIPIIDSTFKLNSSVTLINGVASAYVDATAVFGVDATNIKVTLKEYREL